MKETKNVNTSFLKEWDLNFLHVFLYFADLYISIYIFITSFYYIFNFRFGNFLRPVIYSHHR